MPKDKHVKLYKKGHRDTFKLFIDLSWNSYWILLLLRIAVRSIRSELIIYINKKLELVTAVSLVYDRCDKIIDCVISWVDKEHFMLPFSFNGCIKVSTENTSLCS